MKNCTNLCGSPRNHHFVFINQIKISIIMKYYLSLCLLAIVSFFMVSCGGGKSSSEGVSGDGKSGDALIFGVYTKPDSTKVEAVMFRRITEMIVYDSVKKKKEIKTDTIFGFPRFDNKPLLDSLGKQILDSTGAVVRDPRPVYVAISKDSVRWKGIEGVPLEILLDKKSPPGNPKQ